MTPSKRSGRFSGVDREPVEVDVVVAHRDLSVRLAERQIRRRAAEAEMLEVDRVAAPARTRNRP